MPKGIFDRKSPEERFWKFIDKNGRENENISRCWGWIGSKNRKGYGQIGIDKKMVKAHRYSYAIHNNYKITLEDMAGCYVCHECDNRECVNPDHLFLGCNQDNIDDMCNKGRSVNLKGEKHGMSKLNQEQIIEIRNRYKNEEITHRQLGLEYGVDNSVIGRIIRNKLWSHITTDKS